MNVKISGAPLNPQRRPPESLFRLYLIYYIYKPSLPGRLFSCIFWASLHLQCPALRRERLKIIFLISPISTLRQNILEPHQKPNFGVVLMCLCPFAVKSYPKNSRNPNCHSIILTCSMLSKSASISCFIHE